MEVAVSPRQGPGEEWEAVESRDRDRDWDTLAVDLGTTSIHWRADKEGGLAAQGMLANPQAGAGAEVVSRIGLALVGHAGHLRRRVLKALEPLARRVKEGGVMALAANPAMTLILLGMSPVGLSRAPYALEYQGGEWVELAAGLPSCFIAPLMAPFIGGDVCAGLLELERRQPAYPCLLADMGTNAEFVLCLDDQTRLAASVPMGPALEGVGLRRGRPARPGAMVRTELSPRGLTHWYMDAHGRPSPTLDTNLEPGISGSGYFSLLGALRRAGVIDEAGRFGQGDTPLAGRLYARVDQDRGEPVFWLEHGLVLTAGDIEEFLKVKAAFNLALSWLAGRAGLATNDLSAICLAGALGEHVAPRDLESLGFVPRGAGSRVASIGNASLQGARLLLESGGCRKRAQDLAKLTSVMDPGAEPDFTQAFLERMRFEFI